MTEEEFATATQNLQNLLKLLRSVQAEREHAAQDRVEERAAARLQAVEDMVEQELWRRSDWWLRMHWWWIQRRRWWQGRPRMPKPPYWHWPPSWRR